MLSLQAKESEAEGIKCHPIYTHTVGYVTISKIQEGSWLPPLSLQK